jgi:hypothetical protein
MVQQTVHDISSIRVILSASNFTIISVRFSITCDQTLLIILTARIPISSLQVSGYAESARCLLQFVINGQSGRGKLMKELATSPAAVHMIKGE